MSNKKKSLFIQIKKIINARSKQSISKKNEIINSLNYFISWAQKKI
jgi:hypothetical protein